MEIHLDHKPINVNETINNMTYAAVLANSGTKPDAMRNINLICDEQRNKIVARLLQKEHFLSTEGFISIKQKGCNNFTIKCDSEKKCHCGL